MLECQVTVAAKSIEGDRPSVSNMVIYSCVVSPLNLDWRFSSFSSLLPCGPLVTHHCLFSEKLSIAN